MTPDRAWKPCTGTRGGKKGLFQTTHTTHHTNFKPSEPDFLWRGHPQKPRAAPPGCHYPPASGRHDIGRHGTRTAGTATAGTAPGNGHGHTGDTASARACHTGDARQVSTARHLATRTTPAGTVSTEQRPARRHGRSGSARHASVRHA